jgi:hypothetical protein
MIGAISRGFQLLHDEQCITMKSHNARLAYSISDWKKLCVIFGVYKKINVNKTRISIGELMKSSLDCAYYRTPLEKRSLYYGGKPLYR